MIKALLRVRFKALLAAFTSQARQKKKKSTGMMILFAVLYLYLGVVLCGASGLVFHTLAEPYHALGLDWLYFALAGLAALGFSIFGSVFTTQSQLYDAKDNDLLLAMPVPPRMILLSRMSPLLALNLLFGGIVFLPAAVVHAVLFGFSPAKLLLQLLCLLCITLLSQAVSCLLGWLLHLLLSRMNKSVASMLYMILFRGLYFYLYPQASSILSSLSLSGESIAGTFKTWVWPLYAMGAGCTGGWLPELAFAAICCAAFGLVYGFLSLTFLQSATSRRTGKRRQLDIHQLKTASAGQAMTRKELKRFLGTPVYLTNMGIGLILLTALAIAGLVFRGTILAQLGEAAAMLRPYFSLVICAVLAFTVSMVCISAPSVSLEGKNLWILRSMPVSARQILRAKLDFHCLLCAPLAGVCGIILAAGYGCSIWEVILTGLVPALLSVVCGLLGLVCGLKWARFDWLSEAYPCKQSVAILVVMFSMMGVPLAFGLLYMAVQQFLSPAWFLAAAAAILAAACFGLYRLLMGWGVRRWDAL